MCGTYTAVMLFTGLAAAFKNSGTMEQEVKTEEVSSIQCLFTLAIVTASISTPLSIILLLKIVAVVMGSVTEFVQSYLMERPS